LRRFAPGVSKASSGPSHDIPVAMLIQMAC
jgi:hypothetical protein